MRDSLDRSLLLSILSYAAVQAIAFTTFGLEVGFFERYWLPFFATCLGFHLFLYSMLRLFKADFAIAESGVKLERVNLANLITLFRVSCLPTLLFMVIASKDYHEISLPLLIVIFIVFASDFVDGWVSRATGQVTRIGKMMDSASDYMVLVVLTIVFYYFHFIRVWFFALVLGRLAIQSAFIAILFVVRGSVKSRTTLMGKAAIASIMVLYGAEILELMVPTGIIGLLRWLEWAAAVVVGVSVIDKVLAFKEDLRSKDEEIENEVHNPDGGS